ncbi:hypothetical protein EVAR_8754_1 [Eumeta japonica]|uniref:Uncharacterized protein n=1 Tax=Eumeta variegata TaxID=151549 RepID=A0A4C1TTQ7_EUMVA|nr:hypothetical protein EVAR_8754_1 [Eumeta japonica]
MKPSTRNGITTDTKCCARGRPIIVEWERDARHSAGPSPARRPIATLPSVTFLISDSQPQPNLRRCHVKKETHANSIIKINGRNLTQAGVVADILCEITAIALLRAPGPSHHREAPANTHPVTSSKVERPQSRAATRINHRHFSCSGRARAANRPDQGIGGLSRHERPRRGRRRLAFVILGRLPTPGLEYLDFDDNRVPVSDVLLRRRVPAAALDADGTVIFGSHRGLLCVGRNVVITVE